MYEQTHVDYLLLGICHFLPSNKRFKYNRCEMHSFFYERKQRFPELLEKLAFLTNLAGNYAPQIDQAITNLRACHLSVYQGTNFNLHQRIGSKRNFQTAIEKLGHTKKLEALAIEFSIEFGVR